MHFTKVQISELMRKHAEKENGLHDLMEIILESMMVAERCEFLHPQILAILRNNVTGWPESYIRKDLRRNRSEMSLSRFTAITIPSPASVGWSIVFVPR